MPEAASESFPPIRDRFLRKKERWMEYNQTVNLKDGRVCLLRNGAEEDGQAFLDLFLLTHGQTDYLLFYPDESSFTMQQEAEYLKKKTDSDDEIEILAELDGKIVGSAGIECVGRREKTRHRAEFGIALDKAYWGLGIGRALTEACIACAKHAGYTQLELAAVADNHAALSLYTSMGFVEYGRNPKGFHSRFSEWQELVLMRLELDIAADTPKPKNAAIELRAITDDNFLDAFHLKLKPGQDRFVSHPIRSLAQAYVYRDQCQPFGIYADGTMVGYVMVIYDYDVPEYDIWHMMIDESMQGRGFGSAALDRVLAYIRTKPFGPSDRIALTCNKNNPVAKMLYERKGFAETGIEDEDEIELVLTTA